MDTLTITRPDDWHLHVRDGAALAAVIPHTAQQFARAIIMPNLKPPVTTTALALAYRDRILAAVPAGLSFEPLMTLYLTDNTPATEIAQAKASGMIHAVKYYPAGATTNSDSGVTDIRKTYAALEAMQEHGLPLLVHGEVTDSRVDVFDREKVFIDTVLAPLAQRFNALKIVFEHITTRDAVDFVLGAPARIAATLTAHHLLYNRNAMFSGGMQPHYYCLPVLKRETHRAALLSRRRQRQSEILSRHRQRTAFANQQGIGLRLRRHLHRACRTGTVRRGLRTGRRARSPGSLRQLSRP